MGVIKEINFKITGQVPDDCNNNEYDVLRAKLQVICAEYGLNLEERGD